MKERPILFQGAMVRAILDGSKTQTRRAMKPQPVRIGDSTVLQWRDGLFQPERLPSNSSLLAHCPYGKPGDRLWVRETWYCDDYRVQTGPYLEVDGARELTVYCADDPRPYEAEQPVWRPSIHMPRWASRITLEISAVRIERLNDISQADARAEGAPPSHPSIDWVSRSFGYADFSRSWYAQLWEAINGPCSWDANPWVWVIEFRRVT